MKEYRIWSHVSFWPNNLGQALAPSESLFLHSPPGINKAVHWRRTAPLTALCKCDCGSITSSHFLQWDSQNRIGIKDKNLNREEVWFQIIICCCPFLLLSLKSVFIVLNDSVIKTAGSF